MINGTNLPEHDKSNTEFNFRVPTIPLLKKCTRNHKAIAPYYNVSLSELRVTMDTESLDVTIAKFQAVIKSAKTKQSLVQIAMILGEEDLNLPLLEKVNSILVARGLDLGLENPPNLSPNIAQAKMLTGHKSKLKT